MRERVFAGDHPMVVAALTELARQALRLGKVDYASAQAAKAAAMADRLHPQPAPGQVAAHAIDAAAKLMSADFAAAGIAITRAESLLAALPGDAELQATVDYVHGELCKRPRTPAVPACAGIEPTEPALP
jgi:hypothetical protein